MRQGGVPADDHTGRLARLGGGGLRQEALAVRGDRDLAHRAAEAEGERKERLRYLGVEARAGGDRDPRPAPRAVEEEDLAAVPAPDREYTAGGRQLPAASGAGERLDLHHAGLVRLQGQPAPVGREVGAELGEGRRLGDRRDAAAGAEIEREEIVVAVRDLGEDELLLVG